MGGSRDYYAILGVSRDASDGEIRRAFRTLAKEHHPDSRRDPSDGAPEHDFRLITEAHETLKDPVRRAAYDEELNQERQLATQASQGNKRPFAFAAGVAAGIAIALISFAAFTYFGRGKSGDKAQDLLKSGVVVTQEAAETPPKESGDVAADSVAGKSDEAATEAVQPPPASLPAERPASEPPHAAITGPAEQRTAPLAQEHRKSVPSRAPAPGEPLAVVIGQLGDEKIQKLTPGKGLSEGFSDCASCPEMVVIPSGQTIMGSRPESDGYRSEEAPPHRIALNRPLAISKFVISAQNWRACVDAGVCRLTLSSLLAVGPKVAATRISWFDTKAYVEWLSQTTGWRYRLLTEAEWEYAVKTTLRAEQPGRDRYALGGAPFPRVRFEQFAGPGPNPWGIQSGSVLEWVEDCWHASYDQAPADASAWLSAAGGDCAYRVVRGSAKPAGGFGWRPSARAREFADTSAPTMGFRVARELSSPDGR